MAKPLPTIRTALATYCRVSAHCLDCERVQELNLEALAERHVDMALIQLPLRCRCGSRRCRVVASAREPG